MIDLRLGDCLDVMRGIPDASIDAVITSPPYNGGMTYEVWESQEQYYSFISAILGQNYRILKPGGRVMWVVGPKCNGVEGRHFLAARIGAMIADRFKCVDTAIWTSAPIGEYSNRNNTSWGSWKSPSMPNLRGVPSLVFIGGKDYANNPANGRVTDLTPDEFREFTDGLWVIRQDVVPYEFKARFPVALVDRLIRLYGYIGDTILDPFMGSGTTGVACVKLNRSFIGIEINEEYYKIAQRRIQETQAQIPMRLE